MTIKTRAEEIEQYLAQARAAYRTGQSAIALTQYQSILALDPQHLEALNLAGILLSDRGNIQEGLALIHRAIAINPQVARSYFNRGNVFHFMQRHREAVSDYDRCIALDRNFAPVHHHKGLALVALGEYAQAAGSFQMAIELKADNAEVYFNLGNVLQHLRQYHEAIRQYDKALVFNPSHAACYNNRGAACKELNRFSEAADCYRKAIALDGEYAHAYNNLGVVQKELGQPDEALASYDQAITIDPQFADAYSNKGVLLDYLRRYDEALSCYEKGLELAPRSSEIFNNKGFTLEQIRRYDDAIASYDEAIRLNPGNAAAHFNRASSLLMLGRLKEGWQEFEWRLKRPDVMNPDFSSPQWTGEQSIQGKTVLLHGEQGMGDVLQFCRYVPMVQALGAEVMMVVHRPLLPVCATMKNAPRLVGLGDKEPPHDYHAYLMSLPRIFDTRLETIPAEIPYLFAPDAKLAEWGGRLGKSKTKRVGLVWAGNPKQKNNHNRSMELPELLPLLRQNDRLELHALQKELTAKERQLLQEHQVTIHADALQDFADTAALIMQMDVVLTVCTSVAHLAGALGKPVWLMLCYNADFRWFTDRSDCPWYPTARLFRQSRPADWNPVVEQVKQALLEYV